MKLAADNTRLMIDRLDGALTASQVEDLIHELAAHRSAMHPPVPAARLNTAGEPEPKLTIEEEPELSAGLLRDGRVRLWIRSMGLGWCGYTITRANARAVAEYILRGTGDGVHAPDLFSQGDGSRH